MREICSSGSVRGGGGNIPTYSAQRVPADVKLPGVIAQNHRVAQKLMRLNAAPQRRFGGNPDRVGRDLQRGEAEPVEMRQPRGLISEPRLWSRRQKGDRRGR